jgi:hypothetical protein
VDRVRHLGPLVTAANLPERALLISASGLLAFASGRRRSGLAGYERGRALARRHRFVLQASIAEQLAARVLGT